MRLLLRLENEQKPYVKLPGIIKSSLLNRGGLSFDFSSGKLSATILIQVYLKNRGNVHDKN